ncbi:hypothetical protein BSP99_02195 [Corynebacterium glutamicum]|nr:ABC transporter ATP-binding protein [[Brevibacterium] flavum ZL-1]ANR64415.1 ABC transporter ATP-binding protein [Corynebacterium glutamicum ZL-6]ANU32656.1 hypothetical protein BBD29_02145 [Corynebacterium glutamicum]APT06399.1 hypothetical protein BSP99_02195 [Corynebacterium glutamicum]PST76974.1 ABC transporter ATP-binding protein [Corynebacterium glutamicum ZL-2]
MVEALKPMSLACFTGESIGIIGRNGSGKSTLLSLIAGNEKPTAGEVFVSSHPTLLSVSAALQPHLNALDNVRLGLLAKGAAPSLVEEIEHHVVDWADIGDAIDRPLKTYSSGMAARLKFAIATAIRPQILLVDEALATGDAAFNEKAQDRMNSFLEKDGTVLVVSHSAGTIQQHCSRAIWIHEGEVIADGPTDDVTYLYSGWSRHISNRDRISAAKMIRRAQKSYYPTKILFDSEATAMLDKGMDSH